MCFFPLKNMHSINCLSFGDFITSLFLFHDPTCVGKPITWSQSLSVSQQLLLLVIMNALADLNKRNGKEGGWMFSKHASCTFTVTVFVSKVVSRAVFWNPLEVCFESLPPLVLQGHHTKQKTNSNKRTGKRRTAAVSESVAWSPLRVFFNSDTCNPFCHDLQWRKCRLGARRPAEGLFSQQMRNTVLFVPGICSLLLRNTHGTQSDTKNFDSKRFTITAMCMLMVMCCRNSFFVQIWGLKIHLRSLFCYLMSERAMNIPAPKKKAKKACTCVWELERNWKINRLEVGCSLECSSVKSLLTVLVPASCSAVQSSRLTILRVLTFIQRLVWIWNNG